MGEKRKVWRSMLFIPADQPRFLEKAAQRGADAIQLDLEDAILPENKQAARDAVGDAARFLSGQGLDVIVRINRPWRMAVRDLEAAIDPSVKAISLPKTPNAAYVQAIAEIIEELEIERGMEPGSTGLITLIETPEGAINMTEIAAAHPRMQGMIVGVEDFSLESGISLDSQAMYDVHADAVLAAKAGGIAPYGFVGTISDYSDLDKFAEVIRQARLMGFEGAFCIHPKQVPVVNEGFMPTAEEIAHARRVVEAFEAAKAEGRGAVALDGKMLDRPIVLRAEAILAKAERAG